MILDPVRVARIVKTIAEYGGRTSTRLDIDDNHVQIYIIKQPTGLRKARLHIEDDTDVVQLTTVGALTIAYVINEYPDEVRLALKIMKEANEKNE